jgi:hypothetical protein
MNCQRCCYNINKIKCDICLISLCYKCDKLHTKHNECFIEKQSKKCYMCEEDGLYDFGICQFICIDHI